VPGTTPYAQDGALAYALPAAAAVHVHSVVSIIAAVLFRDGDVVVTGVVIVVVVVVIVVVVVVIVIGLRAQNAVRAFGLRLHFGLQECGIVNVCNHTLKKLLCVQSCFSRARERTGSPEW